MSPSITLRRCADIRQGVCNNVGVEHIGDKWHRSTAERVGEAVLKFRKDAGLTAQQLAERCRQFGVPIHRTTITKIEKGRSRFDLGELLILAAALGVPPLVLIFPDLPSGKVDVIPGYPGTSFDAYLWAAGLAPSFTDSAAPKSKGYQLIEAVLDRRNKITELGSLHVRQGLYAAELENDPVRKEAMEQTMSSLKMQIAGLDHLIRELGGKLDV
jgi:transcriptional regulator with XRE-family HTH domain